MPFLSRVWLNPLRSGTRRLLQNPQAMHAAVLGGLAAQPVTERVLWRVESPDSHRVGLLVLTQSTPSWESVVEQAGWAAADEPQATVRDYAPLLDRLALGREFRFRVVANPVTATRSPTKATDSQRARLSAERARGIRVAARTAEHQLAWLLAKVPSWGFEIPTDETGVPTVRLAARGRLLFSKKAAGSSHRVTISTATFDGVLRVRDVDAARTSLLGGIGSARAYGCGLITLAPTTGAG